MTHDTHMIHISLAGPLHRRALTGAGTKDICAIDTATFTGALASKRGCIKPCAQGICSRNPFGSVPNLDRFHL